MNPEETMLRIDVHAHIIPESFVEVSPSERAEGVYNLKFTDETSGEVLYTAQSRARTSSPSRCTAPNDGSATCRTAGSTCTRYRSRRATCSMGWKPKRR